MAAALLVVHAHDEADAADCPVCHGQQIAFGVLANPANISESNVVSTHFEEPQPRIPSLAQACFHPRGPPPTS